MLLDAMIRGLYVSLMLGSIGVVVWGLAISGISLVPFLNLLPDWETSNIARWALLGWWMNAWFWASASYYARNRQEATSEIQETNETSEVSK